MAIKISGTTVIDDSRNIQNIGIATATTFVGALTGNATGLTGNPSITVTNATVNGVLSVGGTTVILNAANLQINDRDITLGVTTDALGNNVANDVTANHGGISVASTVGTPIINIPIDGVNNDLPTNKQIMWVKQNHYSGLGTDAWIFNYGVSIGNTSTVQNGSRLTVGAGFTVYDTYLDVTALRMGRQTVSTLGVGIRTTGSISGFGATMIDFRGSGISTVTVGSGIATVNVTGGSGGSAAGSVSPVSYIVVY